MNNKEIKLPTTVLFAFTLINLCLIGVILFLGQSIIIPIVLSLLIAILLRPIVVFFNRKCWNVVSITLAVSLFAMVIGVVFWFMYWQVKDISDDWPQIKINLTNHYQYLQHWISADLHVSYAKQQNYINQLSNDTFQGSGQMMGNTISSFSDILFNLALIPFYTFLILLYRDIFVDFLYKVVSPPHERVLAKILTEVKTVVYGYITGLLIEMGIVGVLTTVGLMVIGVQYAVLLGVITAILNLIPYVGILVAASIAVMATLVNSNDFSSILAVLVLNIVIQFIDNNFLVPAIVGDKVRINGFASMVGVVIGGAIWGLPGMFLSIPIIAIFKVVFDNISSLNPWGALLGNKEALK
jgi:predicted PurR-regulated permease PerM